jgi:hypothetical protein
MARLKIAQGDLTIELRFDHPDFILLQTQSNRFIQLAFPHLEVHGATANDVTVGNAPSVGDRFINVMAPRVGAGIKLTAHKIDIGFNDVLRIKFPEVQRLVLGALQAFAQLEAASHVLAYGATLNVHAAIEGIPAATFINGYYKSRPQGLGPDTGGGLGFYYGAEGARVLCSVIVDGSVLVPNGIYMRVSVLYDAKQISADEMLKAGKQQLGKVFTALDLAQDDLDL